jgi:hypothetical protein
MIITGIQVKILKKMSSYEISNLDLRVSVAKKNHT